MHAHGVNETGLMHHADWLPTLLEAAGVAYAPAPGFALHGASQWPMLSSGAPSSRNETITNIDPLQPAVGAGPPGQGNAAIITAAGWKLVLGLVGPPNLWSPPNASKAAGAADEATGAIDCGAIISGTCYPGAQAPGTKPVAAKSAAACCALCSATADCTSFTFRTSTGMCYLKKDPSESSSDPDCVSGGAAPGPPAPFQVWPLTNMTAQLYDLNTDPWERDDVSAAHPDIVAALTARLAHWGEGARDPYFRWDSKVDPRSDPKLPGRNGTWFPWAD